MAQSGPALVRTPVIVRFTPLGILIAEKARRVLREAEELTDMARAEVPPLTGALKMGVLPTIAPFLLPAILPRVRMRWPKLRLFLREQMGHSAFEALHRGQFDCVLIAMPFTCADAEIMELFDDALILALPKHENQPQRIAEGVPDQLPLLLLEQGHCLTDHSLAAFKREQLRGETRMIGTSLHTLVQMVDNGLGRALIPQMAVSAGILIGTTIRTEHLRFGKSSRKIALAWRKGSSRAVEFRMLGNALIDAWQPEE